MKNLFCLALLSLFVVSGVQLNAQNSYTTHIPELNVRNVIGFLYSGSDYTGIKVRNGYNGNGTAIVEMRATNPAALYYTCSIPLIGYVPLFGAAANTLTDRMYSDGNGLPEHLLLYKTTVDGSNPGQFDPGIGDPLGDDVKVYNSDALFSCTQDHSWNPVGSEIKTNSPTFYRRNIQTYEQAWNISDFTDVMAPEWHRMWRGKVPVVVTLTFTGDMTLYDIVEIQLPGTRLSPSFDALQDMPDAWAQPTMGQTNPTMKWDGNEIEITGNQNLTNFDDVEVPGVKLEVWGKMLIHNTGEAAPAINPDYPYGLWVAGDIVSENFIMLPKESWADYVFQDSYQLPALKEVAAHIEEHGHLPGVPSAAEVIAEGYSQHEINRAFLEKIEQLTLYKIDQRERLEQMQDQVAAAQVKMAELRAELPHQ